MLPTFSTSSHGWLPLWLHKKVLDKTLLNEHDRILFYEYQHIRAENHSPIIPPNRAFLKFSNSSCANSCNRVQGCYRPVWNQFLFSHI
jgi:hypothetical protein